ncbi:MAG: GNAT family N-acetyltransferase [Verrucomicrobia bacterium]|nr:GNAT family N-acetyltransferase [Verrucomicrobiota bacterium]
MNLEIRFIEVEDTLPLRSRVLRDNRPLEQCRFAEDGQAGSFHLGAFPGRNVAERLFAEGQLLGIASYYPKALDGERGRGFQLRGMAVADELQRSGVGRALLQFGEQHLRAKRLADFLWCNARVSAIAFYERDGWRVVGEEFPIPEVGPHKRMVKSPLVEIPPPEVVRDGRG